MFQSSINNGTSLKFVAISVNKNVGKRWTKGLYITTWLFKQLKVLLASTNNTALVESLQLMALIA